MKTKNIITPFLFIIVSELAGVIGSIFTFPSVTSSGLGLSWYETLVRPALNPPAWVFGPVWTTLFLLMGIAAYLVYKKGSETIGLEGKKNTALKIFWMQLALNVNWSILFFGLHNPGAAFADIIALWFSILLTIAAFSKVSKTAAWLLVPYILWVSFATYLNFSLWMLN